jgi:hypothetical protein
METIRINRAAFSDVFWSVIFDHTADSPKKADLMVDLENLDMNREYADYNTGSISLTSGWALYSLARYFQPKLIAEVGTFIGRSTVALHRGAPDAEIHTCDASNSIDIGLNPAYVTQYHKCFAHEMFKGLQGRTVDLMHIDGRLSDEDLATMPQTVVFAVDDFEGNEKGVANLMKMDDIEKTHQIIYPPSRCVLNNYGFNGICNTAVFLPYNMIRFVRQ